MYYTNNNMFFSIIIKFSLGATVGHFISVSPFISLAYETPWTVKFYISWCVCSSVPVCVCVTLTCMLFFDFFYPHILSEGPAISIWFIPAVSSLHFFFHLSFLSFFSLSCQQGEEDTGIKLVLWLIIHWFSNHVECDYSLHVSLLYDY